MILFQLGGGIGLVWFIVLYLVAAYIRLYEISGLWQRFEKWKVKNWLTTYLFVSILLLASKILISTVTMRLLGHTIGTSIFYQYYTPTCLVSALCLFMAFKKLNFTGESLFGRITLTLSPLMFGVYIIHENPFIKGKMWEIVSPTVAGNVIVLIIKLLLLVVSITTVCMVIEWVRQSFFNVLYREKK